MEDSYIQTNGIRLHVMQDGPKDGRPVLLLHGFPEFWYWWVQYTKWWLRSDQATDHSLQKEDDSLI